MTALVKFAFEGDQLDIIPAGSTVHVSIRRVCESLGVDFSGQLQKLKEDEATGVEMISTPSAGGLQRVACIDLRSLPLWLATIHPSKVRPEVRPKLIAYKRECAEVLADHFLGRRQDPHQVRTLPPPKRAQGKPLPDGLFPFLEKLVESHDRLAARVEQLEDKRRKPPKAPDLTDVKRRIVQAVTDAPGCTNRVIRELVGGRSGWISLACAELVAEGKIHRRVLTVQHHAYYAA